MKEEEKQCISKDDGQRKKIRSEKEKKRRQGENKHKRQGRNKIKEKARYTRLQNTAENCSCQQIVRLTAAYKVRIESEWDPYGFPLSFHLY